jgi:hypothetical protein
MADEIRHFVLGVIAVPDPATSDPEDNLAALRCAYDDVAGMSEDEFNGAVARLLSARGAMRAAAGTLEAFSGSVRENMWRAIDAALEEFDLPAICDKERAGLFDHADLIAKVIFDRKAVSPDV